MLSDLHTVHSRQTLMLPPLRLGLATALVTPVYHLCLLCAPDNTPLSSRMFGDGRETDSLTLVTTLGVSPVPAAMTLTGPGCQVSAILPWQGRARLRGQARHNWPAPTLRLWLRHSVHLYSECTLTVHTLQPLRVSSHRLFTILSFGSVNNGAGDVIIMELSLCTVGEESHNPLNDDSTRCF